MTGAARLVSAVPGLPRRILAGLAVVVAVAALTLGVGPRAEAATNVRGVTLTWGLNAESGGGAFFGGCNFLSAGTAGDAGSSRLWKESDGFYRAVDGAVSIVKPAAQDGVSPATWATKCQDAAGQQVSAASTTSTSGNRVVFAGGIGTVDAQAGTARIGWTGSFTTVYYGGLTYWSAADPVLTVSAGGAGTLTATASGYGASMDDPGRWVTLAPRMITLATLTGVRLTDAGFTVTPDYLGVTVATPATATPQITRDAGNSAHWGSFPQSFVDFQQETGQGSYWYASGGQRDPAKPATPLRVDLPASTTPATSSTTTPSNTTSSTTTPSTATSTTTTSTTTTSSTNGAQTDPAPTPTDTTTATTPATTTEPSATTTATTPATTTPATTESPTTQSPAAGPTVREPFTLDDAVLRWGMSNEANNRAFAPGTYNFFSAGRIADTGPGQSVGADRWRATDGAVSVQKRQPDGGYQQAEWATLHTAPDGSELGPPNAGTFASTQIVISGGRGEVDPTANTAHISWTGSYTVVFYSGLAFFYVSDPELTVAADGTGQLTATAGGYGADMFDATKWVELADRRVVLADLKGVDLSGAKGLTRTPEYLGVEYVKPAGAAGAEQRRDTPYFGSFPQSFADFQQETGLSGYWYSTGGATDAFKAALPLTVSYSAADPETPQPEDAQSNGGQQGGPGTPPSNAINLPPPVPTAVPSSAATAAPTTSNGGAAAPDAALPPLSGIAATDSAVGPTDPAMGFAASVSPLSHTVFARSFDSPTTVPLDGSGDALWWATGGAAILLAGVLVAHTLGWRIGRTRP